MEPRRCAVWMAVMWLSVAAATDSLGAQRIRVGPELPVAAGLEGRPLVEPHLAIHPANPEHLLAAVMITAATETFEERIKRQQCAVLLSTDGGTSWRRHDFPITACYDPWVAITRDGHAVFTALGGHSTLTQSGDDELLVFHSADGGRTWGERPVGLGRGHDHETVVVDESTPGREGWLYVVSSRDVRADDGRVRTAVFIARSRNGGRTFDPPAHVRTSNLYTRTETPVVLSDGTLVVSFVDVATDGGRTALLRRRGWVVRSTDGGHTFSLPLFVNEACGPPPRFSLSALVASTSDGPYRDRLYFACNLPGARDVVVSHSADRGESWSEPIPTRAITDSTSSRKLMAAATNRVGVLAIAWRDGRHQPGTECFDVYVTASLDGGATFLGEQRVTSTTSCSDRKLNGTGWSDGGDYFGLAGDAHGRFRLLWSDARGGVFQLRTAVVEITTGSPDPD